LASAISGAAADVEARTGVQIPRIHFAGTVKHPK
jgi:hypothetical protein